MFSPFSPTGWSSEPGSRPTGRLPCHPVRRGWQVRPVRSGTGPTAARARSAGTGARFSAHEIASTLTATTSRRAPRGATARQDQNPRSRSRMDIRPHTVPARNRMPALFMPLPQKCSTPMPALRGVASMSDRSRPCVVCYLNVSVMCWPSGRTSRRLMRWRRWVTSVAGPKEPSIPRLTCRTTHCQRGRSSRPCPARLVKAMSPRYEGKLRRHSRACSARLVTPQSEPRWSSAADGPARRRRRRS
jgi:hypothetical protein